MPQQRSSGAPRAAPRQTSDVLVLMALQRAQSRLQGNERHGEGDGLLRVVGPDGRDYTVRADDVKDLTLVPYGDGRHKVRDSTTGLPSSGGRGSGRRRRVDDNNAGDPPQRVPMVRRRSSEPDQPQTRRRIDTTTTSTTAPQPVIPPVVTQPTTQTQAPRAPQLRGPNRPLPQGLDDALQTQARRDVVRLLQSLQPAQLQTLAQEFHALRVREADIVNFRSEGGVSAVVNAANPQLGGGSGVNGAIQRAAGPQLLQWGAQQPGGCPPGTANTSPPYNLGVDHLIHAVGPQVSGSQPTAQDAQTLQNAYRAAYAQARANGVQELGVTALSSGIYGYPLESAGSMMMREALAELIFHPQQYTRLQLTSMSGPGQPDRNFVCLSDLWQLVDDYLHDHVNAPVRSTAPGSDIVHTAQPATTTGNNRLFPRDPVTGRFSIPQPHLTQPVQSYYRPGSGYHHEVQRGPNCGLHVLQQQLMYYSGNNFTQLVSQGAFDAYVQQQVSAGSRLTPQRTQQLVRERQQRPQFDDLAGFTQGLPPDAMRFDVIAGATWRGRGRLHLPPGAQLSAPQLNSMPAIGVTMNMRTSDGRVVEHSTQIIRLRDDAQGNPRFIEVDPARDPARNDQQPRLLQARTMAQALDQLINDIGEDQIFTDPNTGQSVNFGRSINLLLPSRDTLNQFLRNPSLPDVQFLEPMPRVATTTATSSTRATNRAGSWRSASPPPAEGAPRPGVQAPHDAWLQTFMQQLPADELNHVKPLLLQPPPDNLPLVRHYHQVLWRELGMYAHMPHLRSGDTQALQGFAEQFAGRELLVTYRRREGQRDTHMMLRREGEKWFVHPPSNTGASPRPVPLPSLQQTLSESLAMADDDGLRLLHAPPDNSQWGQILGSEVPHWKLTKGRFDALLKSLNEDGVALFDVPELPPVYTREGRRRQQEQVQQAPAVPPVDADIENILMSMVARGRIPDGGHVVTDTQNRPRTVSIRRFVRESRVRRDGLQQELDRTLRELAAQRRELRALDARTDLDVQQQGRLDQLTQDIGNAEQQVNRLRLNIDTGVSGALREILEGQFPDGRPRLDLNELSLMLPSRFLDQAATDGLNRMPAPKKRRRTFRGGAVNQGTGADTSASRRRDMRAVPRLVLQRSPAPPGSYWDGRYNRNDQDQGLRYAGNVAMMASYWNGMQTEQDRRALLQYRTRQEAPVSAGTLYAYFVENLKGAVAIETAVSPLSPNPLDHADASEHIRNAIDPTAYPASAESSLTGAYSLRQWAIDHHAQFHRRRRHDDESATMPNIRPPLEMPGLKSLNEAERTVARRSLQLLYLGLAENPGTRTTTSVKMITNAYVRALRAMRDMQLTARHAADERVLPAAQLPRVLFRRGLPIVPDANRNRQTLVNALSAAPVQIDRDLFVTLPETLQNVLFGAADQETTHLRNALNFVEGLNLVGGALHTYRPRLSVHAEIMAAMERSDLDQNVRSFVRLAMYEMDQRWHPGMVDTVQSLARQHRQNPDAFAQALNLSRSDHFAAVQNRSDAVQWLAGLQLPHRPSPRLQANRELLDSYVRSLGQDDDRDAAARTVQRWIEATEQGEQLFDNPVTGVMFGLSADEFMDLALQMLPRLSPHEQEHLRAFHAWHKEQLDSAFDRASEALSTAPTSEAGDLGDFGEEEEEEEG